MKMMGKTHPKLANLKGLFGFLFPTLQAVFGWDLACFPSLQA